MPIKDILEQNRKLLLQLDGNNPAINFRESRAKIYTTYPHSGNLIEALLDGSTVQFNGVLKQQLSLLAPAPDKTANSFKKGKFITINLGQESKTISKKLAKTEKESKSVLEEQGVNVLFLGLGMLVWKENELAERTWSSPLLLVPVEIIDTEKFDEEKNQIFQIKWNGEGLEWNYSLYEAFKERFRITLPKMPEWESLEEKADFNATWTTWIEELKRSVAGLKDTKVDDQRMVLSYFSFAKYLIYKDLETEKWLSEGCPNGPEILQDILERGFNDGPELYPKEYNLDEHWPADSPMPVLDMDSSQVKVVLEAAKTKCLVVQGPPGTGKSQTITNLIANAVFEGKKVLFVAEKMAALNVVKTRLEQVGLERAILELHGNKGQKKHFIEELKKTILYPQQANLTSNFDSKILNKSRNQLKEWAEAVNTPLQSGYSPIELYGLVLLANERLKEVRVPTSLKSVDSLKVYVQSATKKSIGTLNYLGEETRDVAIMQSYVTDACIRESQPFADCKIDTPLSEFQLKEIGDKLTILISSIELLLKYQMQLGTHFPGVSFSTIIDVRKGIEYYKTAADVPDKEVLGQVMLDWSGDENLLRDLISKGRELSKTKASLQTLLKEDAWEKDLEESCVTLRTVKDHFFNRLFSSELKAAKKVIQNILRSEEKRTSKELLAVVEELKAFKSSFRSWTESEEIGRRYFPSKWSGLATPWEAVQSNIEWAIQLKGDVDSGQIPSVFLSFLQTDAFRSSNKWALEIERAIQDFVDKWKAIATVLKMTDATTEIMLASSIDDIYTSTKKKHQELSKLPAWSQLQASLKSASSSGKTWLVEAVLGWQEADVYLVSYFQLKVWEQLIYNAQQERPVLFEMDRGKRDSQIRTFKEKDELLKSYFISLLINQQYERAQSFGNIGQQGYVRSYLNRVRGIPPVRKFLMEAFEAIASIKPIFLMSPLSVAGYLKATPELFDLVIFDEASQVEPVDAFGAILRGKQIVVVGDTKQMPPSSFFKRMVSDDGNEHEDENVNLAKDVDSIMELLLSRNARSKSLLWHYRSKHHSLISVSNTNFYDERLLIYPSAHSVHSNLGLKLVKLDHSRSHYEGGGLNSSEANEVARNVLEFARASPEKSLGVVAFNIKQKEAIEEAIEYLSREHPELNAFMNQENKTEPFFVKNLENVQGDERDVIFISVGYGKSATGIMGYQFGPLNNPGGEKRLNVLITRAKHQCVVFSNFCSEDMNLDRTGSVGVKVLKDFLYYAEFNKPIHYQPPTGEADSFFEEQVGNVIKRLGYEYDRQVGSSGYLIDIAVKHPEHPGRYVLAIECDGATYHSAKSARDRDRLRQAILEKLSWKFYRIWSTNWFYSQQVETEKLRLAIVEAVNSIHVQPELFKDDSKKNNVVIEEIHSPRSETGSFKSYVLTKTGKWRRSASILDLRGEVLDTMLTEVIEHEGPVHKEVVLNRVVSHFDTKLGSRIRAHLETHLQHVLRTKKITLKNDFMWLPHQDSEEALPRTYHEMSWKNIDWIAPIELNYGFKKVITTSFGASESDIISEVARNFGFKRVSPDIFESLRKHLITMKRKGLVKLNSSNRLVYTP